MRSQTLVHGFSLVELMIGMAVGLFILLGATSVMVSQIGDHRRLTLETRTEQDVRALAELMTREIRSAGAWNDPMRGVWTESNPNPQGNPNANIVIGDLGATLQFNVEAGARGYKLANGVLQRYDGANWQPMTDPNTLAIARFRASLTERDFAMESACRLPCGSTANCPPKARVRDLRIVLDATAKHDPGVRRNLDFVIRLQADALAGVCRDA